MSRSSWGGATALGATFIIVCNRAAGGRGCSTEGLAITGGPCARAGAGTAPYAASKTAQRSSFGRIATSSSTPAILNKIAARCKGDVTKCSLKLFAEGRQISNHRWRLRFRFATELAQAHCIDGDEQSSDRSGNKYNHCSTRYLRRRKASAFRDCPRYRPFSSGSRTLQRKPMIQRPGPPLRTKRPSFPCPRAAATVPGQ